MEKSSIIFPQIQAHFKCLTRMESGINPKPVRKLIFGGALKKIFLILLFFSSFKVFVTTPAFAQSTSASLPAAPSSSSSSSAGLNPDISRTEMKIDKLIGNKEFKDNNEITDPKLRAESGSLSRYSMKFDLTYNGPMVGQPLAKDQPNPDNDIRVHATALIGSLGARYRLSSKSAITMGSGLSALHPIQGVDRFDLQNPFAGYDISSRIEDYQLRNSISAAGITVPNYVNAGMVAALQYKFSLVRDLGLSRYSATYDQILNYSFYQRPYLQGDGKSPNYNIGFLPGLRYRITDAWNVSENIFFNFMDPRSKQNQTVLWNSTPSDRVSLGYSYSRDIYISPFINFFPGRMSWDNTTINISSIFSIL